MTENPTKREGVRVRVGTKRPWWRRKRRRILVVLGLVSLALVLDAVWTYTTVKSSLNDARTELERGAADLRAGRLGDARSRFGIARLAGMRAAGFARHPTGFIAGVLPGFSDDADAVRALARSAELAGDAGTSLVSAATIAGWNGRNLAALHAGGDIDVAAVRRAAEPLSRADASLKAAKVALRPVDTSSLIEAVAGPVRSAQRALGEQAHLVSTAARLAGLLPPLLGADGPRRYLLALQNLSDARATGGFIGVYGVLSANAGRVSMGALHSVHAINTQLPAVAAPRDFARRYSKFGSTRYFDSANYSPDFPTSARVLAELWAELPQGKGPGRVDGVIATDSVWASYVLDGMGPVRAGAWPEPISTDNIIRILGHDTFLLPPGPANQAQIAIGASLWGAVLSRQPSVASLANAMSRGAEQRHFQMYSVHPDEESGLRGLGAAGAVQLARNPLFVSWNDAIASRTGYFAQRSTSLDVSLMADGSARLREEARVLNKAPDHPPSVLLGGPIVGEPVGSFASYASIYLPLGADEIHVRQTPGPTLAFVEHEFGHSVVLGTPRAPSHRSSAVGVTCSEPHAAISTGDGTYIYALQALVQPSVRAQHISLRISLPDGATVTASAPGMTVKDRTVLYAADLTTPRQLWVRYRMPG